MISEEKVTGWLAAYSLKQNAAATQRSSYDREGYIQFHAKRYTESLLFIEKLLRPSAKLLELGEPGPFTFLIEQACPGIQIDYVQEDLRYSISKPSDTYDLILNMEVIEHIKDQKESILTEVDFSGLKQFIRECHRVLKPGGSMFITTPNAGSYNSMNLFFNQEPAWMWRFHFREYLPEELSDFLKEGGFAVTRLITLHVWPQRNEHRYTRIIQLLDKLKSALRFNSATAFMRGDEIFLLAEKR